MKKVFLMVLCLCLLCTAAFAEDVIELKWEDYAEAEAQGEPQELVIPDLGAVDFWIPSFLNEADPALVEGPFQPAALYVSEDGNYGLAIFQMQIDDLEGYINMMMTEGGGSNSRNIMVNGVSCIAYEVEENDMECLFFPITDSIALTFSCSPLNGDEDWDIVKGAIFASVRHGQ